MQFLYWIRYDHHTDPYTEGYIGVSSQPEYRLKQHTAGHQNENPKLCQAIAKGAEMEILDTFESREDVLVEEKRYRPTEMIGWNIIPGGAQPPSQKGKVFGPGHGMTGHKHTDEWKRWQSARVKELKWYNNGTENVRAKECPDGFVEGRMPYKSYNLSEEGKRNLGKAGRKVITPDGMFDTIRQAAEEHNMSWNAIKNRCEKDKYKDWSFA